MSNHIYDVFVTYHVSHVSSLFLCMKETHNTFNSTHHVTIVHYVLNESRLFIPCFKIPIKFVIPLIEGPSCLSNVFHMAIRTLWTQKLIYCTIRPFILPRESGS